MVRGFSTGLVTLVLSPFLKITSTSAFIQAQSSRPFSISRFASQHDPIFEDPKLPWAIDMDGTLIREDVTFRAIRRSALRPRLWRHFGVYLFFVIVSKTTRAIRYIESSVLHDPTQLTFNEELLGILREQKKRGGQLILATASHFRSAEPIAAHCDELFDHVLGSDPPTVWDARALQKAELLSDRYPEGFLYAGNSVDDLEVWTHDGCRAMMLVNCSPSVLEEAKMIPKPFIVID